MRYIEQDESYLKEDILRVSELPMHTPSSEISKFGKVSLMEEISNGKIALEFVLMTLPVLHVEIQV
jgi:hypothetical protein